MALLPLKRRKMVTVTYNYCEEDDELFVEHFIADTFSVGAGYVMIDDGKSTTYIREEMIIKIKVE